MLLINTKKMLPLVAVTVVCAASVPSAQADPFLPVPPASFLNYHVSTARGLSEEVAQDVVVRARLARHFGLSAPSVAAYVRENLVETTLTAGQAGRYRVACIGPSGREYFVSERLAAGTPVFALAATGQPILRLACGNPLVAVLPPPPHKHLAPKPAALALSAKSLPKTAVPSSEIDGKTFLMTPVLTPPKMDTVGPVVQVAGTTQSLSGGKSGVLLPVLFGAAGIGVLSGHHGSSPSGSPSLPITPSTPVTPPPTSGTPPSDVNTPPAAVPEPSSLLLFGLFGGVLVGLQLTARRRQG